MTKALKENENVSSWKLINRDVFLYRVIFMSVLIPDLFKIAISTKAVKIC